MGSSEGHLAQIMGDSGERALGLEFSCSCGEESGVLEDNVAPCTEGTGAAGTGLRGIDAPETQQGRPGLVFPVEGEEKGCQPWLSGFETGCLCKHRVV